MQNTHDLLVGTLSIGIPSLADKYQGNQLRYLPDRNLWDNGWLLRGLFVELRTKKEPSREERDYGVGPWVLVV